METVWKDHGAAATTRRIIVADNSDDLLLRRPPTVGEPCGDHVIGSIECRPTITTLRQPVV
jgi:hypothetical protein